MPIQRSFHDEPANDAGKGSLFVKLKSRKEFVAPDGRQFTFRSKWLAPAGVRSGEDEWRFVRSGRHLVSDPKGWLLPVYFAANRNGELEEIRATITPAWAKSEIALPAGKLYGVLDGAKRAWADEQGRIVARAWMAWKDSDLGQGIEEFVWLDREPGGIDWPLVALTVSSRCDYLLGAAMPGEGFCP